MLSKERYHCKIHTSLTKSSAYLPPSIDNPRHMDYPSPFLQESLGPPLIFQKSQPSINKGGSHYRVTHWLKFFIRIRRLLLQTPVAVWVSFGTKPCHDAPGDLQAKILILHKKKSRP